MNKIFSMLTSTILVMLSACSTPIAPTQPENGVVYNYKSSSFGRNFSKLNVITKGTVNVTSDGTTTVAGIPFFKQGKDNTCGQATITSILNFWGVDIDYQTVINESNPSNMPTDLLSIEYYIKNKGLNVKVTNNSTIKDIEDLIDQGKPPIVLLDFGGLSYEHYIVVSGCNEKKKTILINDPRNGANLSIKQADFLKIWNNQSLGNLLIFGNKYYRPIVAVSSL